MSLAMFIMIIGVVLAVLGFGAQTFGIKSPKWKYIILGFALLLVVLGYCAAIETENQAAETIERVDRAEVQITEIRMPRRMEPETERMLVTRLKPYAGQKYDLKVFRDQDSLELARAIQAILEEAGWVLTNVSPTHATRRYAETRDDGVFIISGKVEARRTSEARMALRDALIKAGLYDQYFGQFLTAR